MRELEYRLASNMGFFWIILDIDVDNVYWTIIGPASRQKVYRNVRIGLHCKQLSHDRDIPSHTESKHRSSHVMTTSARMFFCSCHFSGARLTLRFRSSMGSRPFLVYLISQFRCDNTTRMFELGIDAQRWILRVKVLVDCIVGSPEFVHVGLIDRWPGQTDC